LGGKGLNFRGMGYTARPKNWVIDEKTGPDMERMIWVRRWRG
jgi:hypothetical protein